jgi:hypothetical protein
MHCLTCNYDLSNLTEHRCPECGRDFDPDDASTFDTTYSRDMRYIRKYFVRFAFNLFGSLAIVMIVILADLCQVVTELYDKFMGAPSG